MLTPKEVVAEVVRLRRSSAEDTEMNTKYTHDELCDILHERLTDIGDCFQKYDQISYVVQGPRDQGVDVLLKLGSADEPERYVAFQVKSYSEISDKNQELSKNLKSGLHDAISHYGAGLVQYYIIFFGSTAVNSKRLTATTNEFAKDSIVRVIDERYARTLLDLDGATVAAIVDNFLRREDMVLKKAKFEMPPSFEDDKERLDFLSCISIALEESKDVFDEGDLRARASISAHALDRLEEVAITRVGNGSQVRITLESFPAIRALYYDIKVRHDLARNEMVTHLATMLSFQQQGYD